MFVWMKGKKMIGFYDYTMLLTYLSLVSAVIGIVVSLNGGGHPYLGVVFLMFSGFCDAFDGKVARSKKNRDPLEGKFGIQIDSLADLIAFGVLPACIGDALLRVNPSLNDIPYFKNGMSLSRFTVPLTILFFVILVLYVLAALIRLGYFNVMEEERQKVEKGRRMYYEGLPVTSASLIFPLILLLQYITKVDVTYIYFAVMLVTAYLFLSKISVKKPGSKGVMILVMIGLVEFILLILYRRIF